jgi:tetratricopeptide (TPR) repeat protein
MKTNAAELIRKARDYFLSWLRSRSAKLDPTLRRDIPEHDGKEAVRQSAKELLDAATDYGRRGDTKTALETLDEVVQRLANDRDTAAHVLVASAMFNKGVALRYARQTEAAASAFDEVARRFGDENALELSFWVALAFYNKGFVFADAGRANDAVAAFDTFMDRFHQSSDLRIRQRVADALYHEVRLLITLGQTERAQSVFESLLREFGDSPEPGIEQVIVQLVRLTQGKFDPFRLAHHAADVSQPPEKAEYDRAIPDQSRAAQVYQETLDSHRKVVQSQAARDAALHAEAMNIVTAYRDRLEPFALFLRNFDIEAYQRIGTGPEGAQQILFTTTPHPRIETKVAAALAGRLPVLGIANPLVSLRPDYQHAIPKLGLANESWRIAMHELIATASLIVMELTKLSPGVFNELRIIGWYGKQNSTVIIVSEDEGEQDPLTLGLKQFFHIAQEPRQSLEQIRAQLSAFPRVVLEEEVRFDELASSPPFADLLAHAQWVRGLSLEQRTARRKIEDLNGAATASMTQNAYDAAIAQLNEARALNEAVGDEVLSLNTHSQLGVAYHRQSRLDEALASFTEALRLARKQRDQLSEALFLRDIADCHYAQRAFAEAISSYQEALAIFKATASDHRVATLRKLGSAYSDMRQLDLASTCFDEAYEIYAKANDFSGMLEVRMEAGTAHFSSASYIRCRELLEEAVILARKLNATRAAELCLQLLERANSRIPDPNARGSSP